MIIRHAVCHYCKRTLKREGDKHGDKWVLDNPGPLIAAWYCTGNTAQLFKPHSPEPGTIIDVDTESKEMKWAEESREIPLPKGQAF